MNKKEVAELKRRLKKDHATFNRMVGCYVDCNHEKVCTFSTRFLTLEEEEYYKYLEIANKVLSGTLGNNLLELAFPLKEEAVGGRQQILMALRDSGLEDEVLLDTYFDLIIDTYDQAGNYLILLFIDSYDVMTKTKDQIDLDESEEVYTYLLCALCPVALSKPGLGYLESEQRIGPRIRDWVVGAPDTGFLFPAFNDRSTDIHSCLFYTKNTKEPHAEFMANGLGCAVQHTATEQKLTFHSIIRNVMGPENERTDDVLLEVQAALNERVEEYVETHDEDADPFLLDRQVITDVLQESKLSDEKIARVNNSMEEVFGKDTPAAENVIDSKALAANEVRMEKINMQNEISSLNLQLIDKQKELDSYAEDVKNYEAEIRIFEEQVKSLEASADDASRAEDRDVSEPSDEAASYDVILKVRPEKAQQITSRIIDGVKYLVIPMEEHEHAAINGQDAEM